MRMETQSTSAVMQEVLETLEEMTARTQALATDAAGFSATLQSDISENAVELTAEILAVIEKIRSVMKEASEHTYAGAMAMTKANMRGQNLQEKVGR